MNFNFVIVYELKSPQSTWHLIIQLTRQVTIKTVFNIKTRIFGFNKLNSFI